MDLNDELDGLLNCIILRLLQDMNKYSEWTVINIIVQFVIDHKDLHIADDVLNDDIFKTYVDHDLLEAYIKEDREALYL